VSNISTISKTIKHGTRMDMWTGSLDRQREKEDRMDRIRKHIFYSRPLTTLLEAA